MMILPHKTGGKVKLFFKGLKTKKINIKPGLYEQLVTKHLQQAMERLDPPLKAVCSKLDPGESPFVIGQYLGQNISNLLTRITGKNKLKKQIDVCNKILALVSKAIEQDIENHLQVDLRAHRLVQVRNTNFANHPRPETPLSVSSLLTATSGDPSLVSQLKQEILHADRIDILVSFIKWSGIRIIKDELEEFTQHGKLRVITTSYLGATDLKAVQHILNLPNTEVKVSFDTRRTRLHAKAYIFQRESGFGSSYIGSSNISNPAMTDGQLEKLLITGDDIRAKLIIEKAMKILLDIHLSRGVCFCVSQKHATYMAEQFRKYNISALALTAQTPDIIRKDAISQLKNGEMNFLCVVDLFNEGIDIPQIDTIMFLRPTESLTVFLQQLGRGLRLHEDKDYLTILDFIGQAHKKFNYEIKFRALLGRGAKSVEQEIKSSFPSLPSGCVIEMERQAQSYVLDNIRQALTHANKSILVGRIASFESETGLLLTMFCFSIWNNKPPGQSLEENIDRLKNNPALFDEAVELISLLARRSETVVHKVAFPFVCPLSVHACYTRDEILSGLNFLTFKKQITIREGVKYLSDLKTDLLFITLNKTEKDYSPTTMYKDYALDENTFHWQSQSTTSDTSPTGQRYIHHLKKKSHVFLFVREQKQINNLACPYNFIGPATYVRHSGSLPMSIVWLLKYPMPARLFRSTMRLATA